ncbi:MAG: TIGR03560 family F420-dependent LLM class oxidoreductase [Dehalococcoidia bacterium]
MRFSVWPGPQQPWADTLELAKHADATGWDGLWYADHFMPNAEDVSAPVGEAWTTLAALAAVTSNLRLGTLVTGNTYRHPAVLAKMAAQVDVISNGRVVLGLGSGWQENEHQKYGIPFSTIGGRLARLDEACAVIKGLTTESRTTFQGKYYQLDDAPLEPKPVQRPLPLLIGGGGEQKTLKITAKWADEWNVWGDPATLRAKMAILDGHCRDLGRDPKAIQRSAVAMFAMSDDKAFVERVRSMGRPVIGGSVDEVRATIREYQAAGVDEVIVPDFTLGRGAARLAAYDAFMEQVAPEFR